MKARSLSILLGMLLSGWSAGQTVSKPAPPQLMLWSWFGDDDFRKMTDRGVGIAYLALSLNLQGQSEVTPVHRAQEVWIPPETYQMAVVRLDFSPEAPRRPAFSRRQRELAVELIGDLAALAHPHALQIDFDAPQSAWPFYRQLLTDLRGRLGPDIFLSMTALVSWCDSPKSWMTGLPVDELVPMAFYMGQAAPAILTKLDRGLPFAFPGCRGSLGTELHGNSDPPPPSPRKGQRAYFFPGGKWSRELVSEAQKAVQP